MKPQKVPTTAPTIKSLILPPRWSPRAGYLCSPGYQPHLERLHDNPVARIADLDQLEQIAGTYLTRGSFLTELTLDPPEATSAEAAPPHLDEDYLILSTIHSAKGQEWEAVFVLNVIDGCIPSDMATGSRDQIEEERRLLYGALPGRSSGRQTPGASGNSTCRSLPTISSGL